jgi:hypothetical protein
MMGTIVYLVKNKAKPQDPPRPPRTGSAVIIEVERGQLRESIVSALNAEDAAVLLSSLAMALVRVIRATQIL